MSVAAEPGTLPGADQVRVLYEDTLVPVGTVAAALGLGARDFYRCLPGLGWSRRAPRCRKVRPVRRTARVQPGETAGDTARAMERFIAGRLAALQANAEAGRDADPERTARTIAQYARALQLMQSTLARTEKDGRSDESEPPARSLSALRDELRGHLERIWDEGRAGRGADAPCSEPD